MELLLSNSQLLVSDKGVETLMLSNSIYPDAQRLKILLGLMPDCVKRENGKENQSVKIVTENIP